MALGGNAGCARLVRLHDERVRLETRIVLKIKFQKFWTH